MNKVLSLRLQILSYPSVFKHVLDAQKNYVIAAVLLSTQDIRFG